MAISTDVQCASGSVRASRAIPGARSGEGTTIDGARATTGDVNRSIPPDPLGCQRMLRRQLLDRPAIRHKPARDLAAHMLLHLDDLPACWGIATKWLRAELDCHRVDTGFGRARAKEYFPGYAEARHGDFEVPSFGGMAVDNRDPIMQAMWCGQKPVIFADITQDRRVTPKLRRRMSGARTKSKFGAALRVQGDSYGLICADWTEHHVPNASGIFDCFEQTVADVLSPIIAVARQITEASLPRTPGGAEEAGGARHRDPDAGALDALTSSELEIARLVAQGLSYKEIARIRERSLSTIDHQLRSIRGKMGVQSTANLVSILARLDRFSN